MTEAALRCENISKSYRIGERQSYKALRESLTDAAAAPFRRLRATLNSSSAKNGDGKTKAQFWALKDISFEVKRGEVVGIIGRNGAGKSTLLKILSRITYPTSGEAYITGRVGSLLEVGTGFHPELTGRENTYLNGAILGMKKSEIDRKFDEIVSFAGVERFIDTPVKRYSSGMYMRLAFSIAAHLEPEILLVDEVLAVGDSQFQKKCLGKMDEVARHGRTVFFVSHNMQAIAQLTERCLVLADGRCHFDGPTAVAIKKYDDLEAGESNRSGYYQATTFTAPNQLAWARVHTSEEAGTHRCGEPAVFEFALRITDPLDSLCFTFQVVNELQQPVCHFWLLDADVPYRYKPGLFRVRCEVPRLRLYMGSYTVTTWLSDRRSNAILETLTSICPFEVTMDGIEREEYQWMPRACVYLEDAVWSNVEQESSI